MAVIAYFNVALAVNGFDFAVLWKAAAVNACFAILVPARLWNRTMREFQRRPMMTHVVVATTLFASAAGWYHLAAPHFEAMLRSSTL
jgi:hypothetical protein